MKNTKAILLIILGSFLLATGFAFAGEAYDSLSRGPNFDGSRNAAGAVNVKADIPVPTVTQPAAGADPAPAKPSPLKKVKDFVSNNFNQIMGGVILGFIGFLVIGTGGAGLAVGLGAFAFFMALKHL